MTASITTFCVRDKRFFPSSGASRKTRKSKGNHQFCGERRKRKLALVAHTDAITPAITIHAPLWRTNNAKVRHKSNEPLNNELNPSAKDFVFQEENGGRGRRGPAQEFALFENSEIHHFS